MNPVIRTTARALICRCLSLARTVEIRIRVLTVRGRLSHLLVAAVLAVGVLRLLGLRL